MPYAGSKTRTKKRMYPKRRNTVSKKTVLTTVRRELHKDHENQVLFANVSGIAADPISNSVPYVVSVTTNIAQGTSAITRIGDSITIQRFSFRALLTVSLTSQYNQVRMMVIRSKAPELDFISNIDWLWFYNTPNATDPSAAIVSPIAYPEKKGRYDILWDRTFVLNEQTRPQIYVQKSFKMNHVCQWDRGGNTQKGHIYLVAISDEAANQPTVSLTTMLSYRN